MLCPVPLCVELALQTRNKSPLRSQKGYQYATWFDVGGGNSVRRELSNNLIPDQSAKLHCAPIISIGITPKSCIITIVARNFAASPQHQLRAISGSPVHPARR